MYSIDYHIHSRHSFDGEASIRDICLAAIDRGMNEIAITDHLDIYSDKPFEHILDVDACYNEIDAAREEFKGKLLIKKGVELGQPQCNPGDASRFFEKYSPDFVIGSVHNMESDLDLYYYDWSQHDEFKVYDHYIDWLMELAQNYDFDVMGHITYPLRYIFEARGTRFPLERYTGRFTELFRVLIEKGRGIECNTSGWFQKINEPLPPLELLKLYRSNGGEIITLGSDAHKIPQVSLTIARGKELLREAGFKYITSFTGRKPEFHTL